MKGRSNRPQNMDPPPDEWVDGSWTVDCICGVTFDDGEEMVKCDECDVWVHTRCSRYVKGDDMFACDKCKAKNNRAGADNNTEETEVAQLLIDLPTKTISLERRNNNKSTSISSRVASCSRRPFKLWTDIPMEERVHVQGIPGGDPSLFAGKTVSSIFGPQLWKCTGYVPKKFNFQYREFPSWYENENDSDKGAQENDTDIKDKDNGAGVLLSFSKETNNMLPTSPVAALVDMKSSQGKKGFKENGTGKVGKDHMPRVHNAVKKERTSVSPFVVHSSKRRKDEFSKDRIGKKKRVKTSDKEERRTSDREDVDPRRKTSDREDVDPKRRTSDREDVDPKRRTSHSSKTAFTSTSDAKQLPFYGGRGPKVFKDDIRNIKNKNVKDSVARDHISNDSFAGGIIMEASINNNVTTTEESSEALYPNKTRQSHSAGDVLVEGKTGHKVLEMSSKTDDAVTSVLKHTYLENASAKKKGGDCLEANHVDDTLVRSHASPQTEDHCGSAPEHMGKQVSQDIDCNQNPSSGQCKVKVKREEDDDDKFKLSNFHSSPISGLKNNGKPSNPTSVIDKVNDAAVLSLPSCEGKVGNVGISSEVLLDNHTNKLNELPGDFCRGKEEVEGSEGSLETQKGFSKTKDGLGSAKNPSKSETLECPSKMLASVGKLSPTSSTMNSKSFSQDFKSEDTEIANPFTKHGAKSDRNNYIKSESCMNDASMDEIPRKSVRERPKSSLNHNSKGLHSSRSMQNSVSKQVNPDARDSVHCSSTKPSSGQQTPNVFGSSESNASIHHQKGPQVQNKISSSAPQKVEKLNQTNAHPSSKLNQNNTPSLNPSPTLNSSMLSDEELALLLHQELNSSPRVPRVPRARQTGSLPQLTSTSATNMLMKRASVGGKDNYLVCKRKYKDATRDGVCSSREPEDETKRIEKEKVQSSSDQRKHDMAYMEDASVKEEGSHACVTTANSITSNVVSTTPATENSNPLSPGEDCNLSSMRNSPRNISDDDTATPGRPVHHTLPGLINDIMSKGRRMTYEELCGAVLPHWPNLRKHNGERYAYASHSQAVLDCLRNRHEWARLVDRGPKTNTTRKRRSKLDAEESDDNEYDKGKTAKDGEGKNLELQKEEFPKGKRKARKRRRLALQGKAVKDVRRKQKADSLTGEDVGPFSNTSEESLFSEDGIQVDRTCPAGSTSDEAGSA
ncbi:uncharacterized protein LOC127098422 [Lathyrus oleraceus]|uniref:Zinc finger PHD-type domain-containing protein n=1 Tax=Pisum sativum TaxID=3888 RepID=A0A9D4W5U1_PEA|nr:uncharacterized protein LOC127098422 [Pisum sativum]KAI5394816.1 hypothetical protein KIW84_061433 [Pisum sativum]